MILCKKGEEIGTMKNEVKSLLKEMETKAREAREIGGKIREMVAEPSDVLFDTLDKIQDCEMTAEEAYKGIESLLDE